MSKLAGQKSNWSHGKQSNRQRGKQRHQSAGHGRRSVARKEGRLAKNAPPIQVTIIHVGGRGDAFGKAVYTHNHQSQEHLVFVPESLPGARILA